jgi:hypothetical protein
MAASGLGKLLVSVGIAVGLAIACGGGEPQTDPQPPLEDPAAPTSDGGRDAGPPPAPDGGRDGGTDGGETDGGGTDGGTDGGPPISIPPADGWTFHTAESSGAPRDVWGASMDGDGNLWVAGGDEGLFVLPAGEDRFRRFTAADGLTSYTDHTGVHGYKVISVAGGPGSTVHAGYQGLFAGQEDNDPEYMRRSGDADRVTLTGAGIHVQHVAILTPPGFYPGDPDTANGRDKIRTVHRILHDWRTGNVWFGGNHGVALWEARTATLYEHQHQAINSCRDGRCSLLSGDWYGMALDGNGDLWMGGGHRVARLRASTPARFWAVMDPVLDVWPDASSTHRTDDFVQDLAVMGDALYIGSIPNGLARYRDGQVTQIGDLAPGSQGKVTALEADEDGSLWVGHQWGGVTRVMPDGSRQLWSYQVLGAPLISEPVWDIQIDRRGGQRRMLVSFRAGAIGVYHGP